MALMSMEPQIADDFVLTISDDETLSQLEEEDDSSKFQAPATTHWHSRKRKRQFDNDADVNGFTTDGKRKNVKSRTRQKLDPSSVSNVTGLPRKEHEIWTVAGEDDGAIDSDFEFQVGDIDFGIEEDFDGWGANDDVAPGTVANDKGGGDKKAVDIDALIARRRLNGAEKQTESRHEKTPNIGEHTTDKVNVRDTESEAKDADAEEEEEDEMLAEDTFGMGAAPNEEEDVEISDDNSIAGQSSEDQAIADEMPDPKDLDQDGSSADETEDQAELAKREAFFATEEASHSPNTKMNGTPPNSFQSMSLSRPILRGLASINFTTPTPIQAKTIPLALLGTDIVGGAVTGSGKTAAFIVPILERLLYRPKKVPTTRVAILMPTRELAVQCFNVSRKLASYADITFVQLVGGFSLREQEAVLKSRPDVIIATPGRFIDHMRNSASFTVETLEILVLDEADRMLEDGFADELNEILAKIPRSRQTMLFSATMTSRVDSLVRLGLNRPVRLLVDSQRQTVQSLTQEFLRLRPGREDFRLGYLLHLCTALYISHTIVFFRQKTTAHRTRIIFGLLGLKAAELHGSMSQAQRIAALSSFRSGTATHLLATDLASRGLDIANVSTVINFEAPQCHEIYLHRVGRTARAGRSGRACTIAAELDRKVVKQAVKAGKSQGARIVSRVVEPALADFWAAKASGLDSEVEEILKEEREERALAGTEMVVRKGENLIEHEDEIKARPKRTWFESEREKVLAKNKGQVELNGAVGLGKKNIGGKLSRKDKKRLDDGKERKEGRVWKKGKGHVDGRGGKKGKDGGGGRKGNGGKEGGGKAKKVSGGWKRR
ncbi:nucleolar DEAD-box protein required for synthesis of 60S ribosomal subunit [Puttea exsequens]|nr:nucleolar DEAD-box protein required for synthesis of 60S ribosomal subunit [Puttea exsequens]